MNVFFRLQTAILVAIVAIGGALVFIAPRLGPTGSSPAPTGAPSSSPGTSLTACEMTPDFGLVLSAGCTYHLRHGGAMVIAGTGAYQYNATSHVDTLSGTDHTSVNSAIDMAEVTSMVADPCAFDGRPLPAPVTTAAAWFEWLGQTPLGQLARTPVTIGGLSGQQIEIAAGPWPTPVAGGRACNQIQLIANGPEEGNEPAFKPMTTFVVRIAALDAPGRVLLIITRYATTNPSSQDAIDAQLQGFTYRP